VAVQPAARRATLPKAYREAVRLWTRHLENRTLVQGTWKASNSCAFTLASPPANRRQGSDE